MRCLLLYPIKGHHLSVLFFFLSTLFPLLTAADCSKAKRNWLTVRYEVNTAIQTIDQLSGQLKPLCPNIGGNSCCDEHMEQEMYAVSRQQLKSSISSWLLSVAQQMESDCVALNFYFLSDLQEARVRLHETFSGIYGYNYKRNQVFFFTFFENLEKYMLGQRDHLEDLVDNFFNQIRTNIVVLMEHSSRPGGPESSVSGSGVSPVPTEDSSRIKCISESLSRQNPFDGVDKRIRALLLESYPPARMLVNSLAAGGKLLRKIADQASNQPECAASFARLRYCAPYCGALQPPRTDLCSSACEQFSSTCFPNGASASGSLDAVWQKYIDSIESASKRLERAFNFPVVNKDLHMSLSEAITFVQKKYLQVKTTLEKECSSGASGALLQSFPGMRPPSSGSSPITGNRWASSLRTPRSVYEKNSTLKTLNRPKRQMLQPQPPHRQWVNAPTRMEVAPSSEQAAPDFLNWMRSQQQPERQWRPAQSAPAASAPSINSRDRLNRWAVQLKSYYTGHKNLFKAPPEAICPRLSTSRDCYNPPPVPVGQIPRSFSAAVDELSSVSSRLYTATEPDGDPEASKLGTQALKELTDRHPNTSASLISPPDHNQAQPTSLSGVNQQPPSLMVDQWQPSGGNSMQPNAPTYSSYPPAPQMENRNYGGMQGSGDYQPEANVYGEPQASGSQRPPSQYQPLQPVPDSSVHLQPPPSMGSGRTMNQPQPVPPPFWSGQSAGGEIDQGQAGSGQNMPFGPPDGNDQYSGSLTPNQYGQPETGYQPNIQQPPVWQWRPDANAGVQQPPSPNQPVPSWPPLGQDMGNQWQPQPQPGYPPYQPGYGGLDDDNEASGTGGEGNFYPIEPQGPGVVSVATTEHPTAASTTTTTTLPPPSVTTVKPTPVAETTMAPFIPTEPKLPAAEVTQKTTKAPVTTKAPPLIPPYEPEQPLPDEEGYLPPKLDRTDPKQPEPQPPVSPSPDHRVEPPQEPWGPRPPYPEAEGSGYPISPDGQPHPQQPLLPPGGIDGPPDCTPNSDTGAMDPRCYMDPRNRPKYPQGSKEGWVDPSYPIRPDLGPTPGEGSGEYPYEPMPPYDTYPDGTPRPEPPFGGLRPDLLPEPDLSVPKEHENVDVLPPGPPETETSLQPALTESTETQRTLPPDVWVPAPGHQPGQVPDSKLFLPDYPVHQMSPTTTDPITSSSLPFICSLPIILIFPLLLPLIRHDQLLA